MRRTLLLSAIFLEATIMTQATQSATPDPATDPQIDPQVRAFLQEINKDSSPFWELPQPKPQGRPSHGTGDFRFGP
jgi:acetyl esterase